MAAAFVLFSSCTKSKPTADATPTPTVQPELALMEYGRLVDVYGYTDVEGVTEVTLFERDVIIGPDITDERPSNTPIADGAILYDFIGTDPDTLQARLLIPRDIDSPVFEQAVAALDDDLTEIGAQLYGTGGGGMPFSVVPRNAAIRLSFTAPLGVEDAFFVTRNEQGIVTSLINSEAVQLLRIVSDPEQSNPFVPLPVRVIPRLTTLTLDPVLLGTEGVQYQAPNNAEGMPASSDMTTANIRIAIALDGPLAIPRMRETRRGITGSNNTGALAIVRDFRSGNANDNSAEIARGFVRDELPLRIVGQIPMLLERVDSINSSTQEITVYKNGLSHEIDVGDVIRIQSGSSNQLIGKGEVVVDPVDDRDNPDEQHVRVRIRHINELEANDPSNLPGYPQSVAAREEWLREHAPAAICIAEFRAGGVDGRDDPINFLTFSPEPLTLDGYRPANGEFVSPFAGAVVRFTKPVDLDTVKWADTFFFAMRDLTSESSREAFIDSRPNNAGGTGIDTTSFNDAKYRTPFLISSRIVDEDGSQTTLRLQPTNGFFLDETMRTAAPEDDYRYFLHVIANSPDGGVRDLAGNAVDLQGTTAERSGSIVVDFTVDTRKDDGVPLFDDNIVVSVVRRFADPDEDARPSLFKGEEVRAPGAPETVGTSDVADLFGAFLYLNGQLAARPTSRVRAVADNFNQLPPIGQPPGGQPQNPLAWCPQTVWTPWVTRDQVAMSTAGSAFGQPIQNPLNPAGCRLQTLWREIDMSLSRDNPWDFNLDIEQMYWAPFAGDPLLYDEFDRVSLVLGHSEFRPTPCVGAIGSLPWLTESGLKGAFDGNYLRNQVPTGNGQLVQTSAPRNEPYTDARLQINPSAVITADNGGNRFLPLPQFQEPYFVWRDETVVEQGCDAGIGSDLTTTPGGAVMGTYAPYILSPFHNGQGSNIVDGAEGLQFVPSYWNDSTNYQMANPNTRDNYTGGLVGSIALPLLADFQTFYDSTELPASNPFQATGSNGWQVSVTVGSDPRPRFRVFSGGRPAAAPQGELPMGPNDPGWNVASGGWALVPGNPQAAWTVTPLPVLGSNHKGDNTFYWIMMDLLKRQSVVTSGFVDLNNPHRVPEGFADARLGPFYLDNGNVLQPADVLPSFGYSFDPPLTRMPAGTSVTPQFRGASAVDDTPWYWQRWVNTTTRLWPTPNNVNPSITPQHRQDLKPTADNFALDPRKAGDAHIRKWDTRPVPGGSPSRNWWTHLYNRTVTGYVEDPNHLMNAEYAESYSSPGDPFAPNDVRYVNWRFVMQNNVTTTTPIDPAIETFAMTYRFQRR